jgi:hypothetical protein
MRASIQDKLARLMTAIAGTHPTETDVICIQEVSPLYKRFIVEVLPQYRCVHGDLDDCTATFVHESMELLRFDRLTLFPDSYSKFKAWRRFSQTFIAKPVGSKRLGFLIFNVHIIDGQNECRIPGDSTGVHQLKEIASTTS